MKEQDHARYLQEALAIARSRKAAPSPEEFMHVYALACQLDDVLTALILLEEVASTMPADLDPQSGVHETLFLSWQRSLQQAVRHAREVIHAAGAWTEAEEIQANLMRDREAELGPDLPSRDEREADEIASEFMDVPVSQGPHGVFSVETDEDLSRRPTPPAHDAHRGDIP